MFGDVLFVLKAFVAKGLFGIIRAGAVQGYPVDDVSDLAGEEAERVRSWDSCFTLDHSHVHGGSVRNSPPSRYRQWMTHKLATWIDQFGTSGCVGCGRCITWCPVAIDITEEAAAIRATDLGPAPEGERGISADH